MLISPTKTIYIGDQIIIGGKKRFVFIGGPCAIESEQMCIDVAGKLKEVCELLQIEFVFKSSFDKANRSSIYSKRGIGMESGLAILENIKKQFAVPILTDVHET